MEKREQLFEEMMQLAVDASVYIQEYEKIPRTYGTEDLLYQVECHTIEVIGDNPGITAVEIARKMNKTKSALSQLINRLCKRGFVVKRAHPNTGRSQALYLTPEGETIHRYHQAFDKGSYSAILSHLEIFSSQDLETYLKVQRIVVAQLRKNVRPHEE